VHTRLDRLIEVIDQLVDEQLAGGESRDEYDYGCICIGERDACRNGCIQGHPRVTSLSLRPSPTRCEASTPGLVREVRSIAALGDC
jgi:hypothetical protein